MLDAKEYLHLAMNAMARDEHHAALSYIKKVLILEPQNASAIYLLAAEHAELKLFDRAIEEMEKALSIDPSIEMARFQLGLLYLKSKQPKKAVTAFTQLAEHSQTESLRAYAGGLAALSSEDIPTAREKLALGLSRHNDNPALKKDMQELLNELLDNQIAKDQKQSTDENSTSSVYLGAYSTKN